MKQTWAVDEIEVVVRGVFTTHHRLQSHLGTLGEFAFPAFRSAGLYHTPDGRTLSVGRTSWWRGRYELREGDAVLATASTRGLLRTEIVIQFAAQEYTLQQVGFWNRVWRLVDPLGTPLLEIRPRGVLRRGACLTVQGPLEGDLLAFAYYLVRVRWEEETAVAAAAGGS